MIPTLRRLLPSIALLSALLPTGSVAGPDREPCAERDPLRRPHFGDLHVHTRFSLDASTQGTRNGPADAYRFARGEPLGIQPFDVDGRPLRRVRLDRPLDFAAVTDHAELIGEWNTCNTPGLAGHDSLGCRVYRRWPRIAFFWLNTTAALGRRASFCGPDGARCLEASRAPWAEIRDAAEAATDRSAACRFTTFIGYEWTGAAGLGNNFHRNVIFSGDRVPELPFSFVDGQQLDLLWEYLRSECSDGLEGCDAVVIPHNSNLSGGMMFQSLRGDGSPITVEDARARARFETLVEVMQHKGDSECMLGTGTEDELCSFEKLTMSSFGERYFPAIGEPPKPRQFVRHALEEGLAQADRIGVNPFQYGLIASSDTHLATPGLVAESAAYPGHGGAGMPAADAPPRGLHDDLDFNPGGLAVLWAEENSRASLFAAMRRREAYGTSGPRMLVRFFGGWDYPRDLCDAPDLAAAGYAGGVPMGGELPAPGAGGAAPTFAVSALRDPGADGRTGTPLQRAQIIKGWTEDGALRERVYDVAGNAENGASVDLATCEKRGGGRASLCAVWSDPDFDPSQRAFYYARVVENPTCRWSQKICVARGVRCDDPSTVPEELAACCSEDHRPLIQERAWTSPIWYRPPAARMD